MNAKNRFGADSLSFAFRPDFAPLLVLDTVCQLPLGFPYLHNHGDYDGTTVNLLVEESIQRIFHPGINEA
jgi:hypothetical protein